ncbi:MAG: hypothetical protein CYG60_02565 [Actinobacteria bacterium]|nr:MAG: hypothetical protein CYG60_02565 [Actinomycetota bacterium]
MQDFAIVTRKKINKTPAAGGRLNVRVDGARLRELRKRKAMERRELERASGVHWTTIARLELGQAAMRISTARKLADALGVDPSEFVGEEVVA